MTNEEKGPSDATRNFIALRKPGGLDRVLDAIEDMEDWSEHPAKDIRTYHRMILDVTAKEGECTLSFRNPHGIIATIRCFRMLYLLFKYGLIESNFMITVKGIIPEAKKLTYEEYLKTPEWREKAEAEKERAGQRCQICNVSRNRAVLDAHHRTYERLGCEEPGDITVLCRACHETFHEHHRLARPE